MQKAADARSAGYMYMYVLYRALVVVFSGPCVLHLFIAILIHTQCSEVLMVGYTIDHIDYVYIHCSLHV